jgi:hypothetical protein
MRRFFLFLRFLLPLASLAIPTTSWGASTSSNLAVTVTQEQAIAAATPFQALHTYFISPTGSDSNPGTKAQPWASPNHSVVCGDVIIAAAGAYNNGFSNWGAVSNCPSTTGGIDGAGGIYFAVLLCGGPLNTCTTNYNQAQSQAILMSDNVNNWALEGWWVTTFSGGSYHGQGIDVEPCSTITHHHAFINNVTSQTERGTSFSDCGTAHNVPGNGADYSASVGNVIQDSAEDPICLAAVDAASPANFDTASGTHVFFYNNYEIANNSPCGGLYDGEDMMFDTWNAHGFTGQGVVKNNIGYLAGRMGMNIFTGSTSNASHAPVFILNNTFFENNRNTGSDSGGGEILLQGTGTYVPVYATIQNNIAFTGTAASPSGSPLYALQVGGNYAGQTIGGSGTQNIFKGLETVCGGSSCDSGDNVVAYNGGSFGTNTYVNPAFKNTTDLLSNHAGPVTCSGFTNTTACMGWNAVTQTMTSPSVIDDLTPTAGGMTGKGFQLPSTTCVASDPYYPTWLKGIVYLQWNASNSTITEVPGLVTKPCGL